MLSPMKSLLLSTLLMIAFATGAKAAMTALTEQDAGREVIVKKEREFLIRLPANPTTGYSWRLSISPSDLLLQKKAPQYQSSVSGGKLLGSGGFECWRFRFTRPGLARLSFAYARPWEKGIPPVRQLVFSVRR
jgi:inhibitor of cysteine peptidase